MSIPEPVGITGIGGYIPRLRLSRGAIAEANAWFNPGLKARAKGERAMGNWDEDCLTMAVEAGRDCVGEETAGIDAIYLASTTLPFSDRLNAGIVSTALSLPEDISGLDVSSCQKAACGALVAALGSVGAGCSKSALVVASDKRKTRAAAPQEMQFGDGAAAVTVGREGVIAEFLGSASSTVDFVDHFRGEGEAYDYNWEERWIRDEGLAKLVPPVIGKALENASVAPSDVSHFIFPTLFPRMDGKLAKMCGVSPEAVCDDLSGNCGNTGAAHPLLMLVHALETSQAGDVIVLGAFGQGVSAVVFRVTDAIDDYNAGMAVSGSLSKRKEETNYLKWLAFNGLIELEKGMRAEKDNKTALSVTYRKRDMLFGLVGGKCSKCGTAQFPRTRICVNPNCHSVDTQEPFSYANQKGRVLSWSADHLTYSLDPPQHYGMVTFEEGGRFLADFTDVEAGTVESGMEVRMVFRIKDFDERRGFRRYFWKAVPVIEEKKAAE